MTSVVARPYRSALQRIRAGRAGSVGWAMGFRAGTLVASLALSILVARIGGPEAKGAFSLFTAKASLCGAFLSLGIAFQIVRETRAAKRRLSVWYTFLTTAVLLTAAVTAVSAVAHLVGAGSLAEALLAGYFYVLPTQAAIIALAFRGALVSNRGAVLQPLGGLGLIGVFLLLDVQLTSDMVIAVALAAYLAPLPYFASVMPRAGGAPSFRWTVRRIFGRGIRWQPSRLVQYAIMRGDLIVVGYAVGVEEAGVYSVALSLSELGLLLPRVLASDSLHAAVQGSAIRPARLARNNLLLSAACALVLLAVSPFATPLLYGDEFGAVPRLLLLLIPGGIAYSVVQVGTMYANALGAVRQLTWVSLLGGVVFTVAIVPLVGLLDAQGAAIASSLAYVTMAVASLAWLRGAPDRPANADEEGVDVMEGVPT
jgi:O-antigen/teichoic acid export membrane protein